MTTTGYRDHDPGHGRLIAALRSLPRQYRERAGTQLERIRYCNHTPVAPVRGGEWQQVVGPGGRRVQRGWHCNSPLCHRAAVTRAEKTAEKYMIRAATRVKFGYYAITLTSIPVVGMGLREAFGVVERARARLFSNPEYKRVVRGGIWRIEFTARSRAGDRSWFIHVHLLVDGNFNSKRKDRLHWLWGQCLEQEGGERPSAQYQEPVERMDAYIRYLRKDMNYSDWTDPELREACMFLMGARVPVLTGAFGSWSDRTRAGRPYREAKEALVRESQQPGGIEIPRIDFTDIKLATHVTFENSRSTLLGIYPAVRGHGMEVREAAAAELIGNAMGRFVLRLRTSILLDQQVTGVRTGEKMFLRDVLPRRAPRPPAGPAKSFRSAAGVAAAYC